MVVSGGGPAARCEDDVRSPQGERQATVDQREFEGVLGAGTRTTGELTFEGTLRIGGVFRGEIRSDSILVVGPEADVDAQIDVGELIVDGEVRGSVRAKRRILIHATGRVSADITTASLAMESGAVFNGTCEMKKAGERESP